METIEELLSGVHSSTVTDVSVLVHEVRVRVGVLATYVTIRVYRDVKGAEPYHFELSAHMKTGASAARDTNRRAGSANEAIRSAVRLLTRDYEEAVRSGEMPDEKWLVQGEPV